MATEAANRQCFECQRRMERWDWHEYQGVKGQMKNSKRCLACKTTHPVAYFSRAQRYHPLPRRCIGHEGYVRLCEHQVIHWHSVVQAANQLRLSERRVHVRIQLAQCRHQSHLPSHHGFSKASENTYPSITIENSGGGTTRLVMSWTGHMSQPRATTCTPSSISNHLTHFRTQQSGGAAASLAPLSAPGCPLPEVRCFNRLGVSQTNLAPRSSTPYGIRISINPCPHPSSSCLEITYQRTIIVSNTMASPNAITHSWVEALDPNSYGALPWSCRQDPACPNYFLYLERPILRACGLGFKMVNWTSSGRVHLPVPRNKRVLVINPQGCSSTRYGDMNETDRSRSDDRVSSLLVSWIDRLSNWPLGVGGDEEIDMVFNFARDLLLLSVLLLLVSELLRGV